MALIDLARQEHTYPGLRCAFGQWFDTLPTTDKDPDAVTQAAVLHLLAADDVASTSAARVLSKVSRLSLTRTAIARHRPHTTEQCSECTRRGRLTWA